MSIIIQNIVYLAIFASLLINGVLVLMEKWGVLEWLQLRIENKFFSKMVNCYFCLSHHLSVFIILPILLTDFHYMYFFVPLMVSGLIHLTR